MSSFIFINYRREDSAAEAMLVKTALADEFGKPFVFMDVSSIELGTVWPQEIAAGLDGAKTVISVIGPDWLRSGSDEWGRRRIDHETDWVRKELELAFKAKKKVIPLLVRGARMPPADVLPDCIRPLQECQALALRREYWDHDIKLLLNKLTSVDGASCFLHDSIGPYPRLRKADVGPSPVSDAKLKLILEQELTQWKIIETPLPEDPKRSRTELFRELTFKSFAEAIGFMSQVASGCDIANHHPRWENIFKTLRVYLTTWNLNHRISDRDLYLASYFNWAYADYPGAAKPKKP